MPFCFYNVYTQGSFFKIRFSENIRAEYRGQFIVRDMLYNRRSLLLVDNVCCTYDKFLGVITELFKRQLFLCRLVY